jgi:8-oxo-dGTP diphosphatase
VSKGNDKRIGALPDRTDEYLRRDLDGERIWPASSQARYGGVIINVRGEVLLREPTNHFDGYVWTFPKGAPEKGESSAQTALREVFEETGLHPRVVGHLADGFSGTSTGWVAYFYLMVDFTGRVDEQALAANGETATLRWASPEEARSLISKTTNAGGRKRDLAVLEEALDRFEEKLAGASEGI